jgi:predicted ATPase
MNDQCKTHSSILLQVLRVTCMMFNWIRQRNHVRSSVVPKDFVKIAAKKIYISKSKHTT